MIDDALDTHKNVLMLYYILLKLVLFQLEKSNAEVKKYSTKGCYKKPFTIFVYFIYYYYFLTFCLSTHIFF